MPLNFTTADQRIARPRLPSMAVFGPFGVGKTYQCRFLPPEDTLFIDLEAGDQALGNPTEDGWKGDTYDVREEAHKLGVHPWELTKALACVIGGPDPAAEGVEKRHPLSSYNRESYDLYQAALGPTSAFDKYSIIFTDSITVAGRHSFQWSQMQPDAKSEGGKYDGRGAYGRHGQEMITWLTQLHHIRSKAVIVVGLLDSDLDAFKRPIYSPQIDGQMTANALPGIFDQVLTLGLFTIDEQNQMIFDVDRGKERAFVCHKTNPYGVPAKDRSGTLDLFEPANLWDVMNKIMAGKRLDSAA